MTERVRVTGESAERVRVTGGRGTGEGAERVGVSGEEGAPEQWRARSPSFPLPDTVLDTARERCVDRYD